MFDVIVVGGGPAGLSAALMLGRCRRTVLLCDAGAPRNRRSNALHGYLTRDGIPPAQFNELGRRELTCYGIECRALSATSVARVKRGFKVSLADGRVEHSRFLLIATGVVDELPPIAGLADCYGRSVFHCPYCDGWEWRDRRLAVYGAGASGAGLALSMKTWSSDVALCTGGRRVARPLLTRLGENGVTVHTSAIDRLEHEAGLLQRIVFDGDEPIVRDALFFSTGQHLQCDLAVSLGCAFNHKGTVKTGTLSNTNVDGVFVAGDASRDAQFVVVAAAEGVKAAVAINRALEKESLH